MNRLRNRLILTFLAATLAPIGVTLWVTHALVEYSLGFAAASEAELDRVSRSLEQTGRELYRQACASLKREAEAGRIAAREHRGADRQHWPPEVAAFWESAESEAFRLTDAKGGELEFLVRQAGGVRVFRTALGIDLSAVSREYARARETVARGRVFDRRRGFLLTFLVVGAAIWALSFGILVVVAFRLSRPIQQLTAGLDQLAAGNLAVRLPAARDDEIGRAIQAFNHTASQLEQNRDRLVYLTQLASWQSLARKMAHEVKNSLTPIRLMVEEIAARQSPGGAEPAFLEQSRQIIVEEIEALERRIRAFSQFSAEPAVRPGALAVNELVQERVAFLRHGHPEVDYRLDLAEGELAAWADEDLVKGVLTNLIENAAEAAGAGGAVLAATRRDASRVAIEIHDSGPGLPEAVRESLFQPTITFKKNGMGLGLSIAKKSALLTGGDLVAVPGQLGGAGFRVWLPAYETNSGGG